MTEIIVVGAGGHARVVADIIRLSDQFGVHGFLDSVNADRHGSSYEGSTILGGEEMLPWLREIEGIEGLLMLSDAATGTTLVLSFWESEEIAEKHGEARRQFRESITSAVNVEVVETNGYDLTFAHLGPWATEPTAG